MDHTLALIGRAHQGDKAARDTLVEENAGLVYSVAKRFVGRGVDMEDLIQIGSIGLIKAVDKFDLSYDVRFSTYAVPMIAGEIKRYLRDDGLLKVSRSLKENYYRVYKKREELEYSLGREPMITELSKALEMPVEDLVMTMEAAAEVESLQKSVYQGENNEISLSDKLAHRILLEELLAHLDKRERQLICMRYFQDMTQMEVAAEFGISQVQVSRLEKRILNRLKELI